MYKNVLWKRKGKGGGGGGGEGMIFYFITCTGGNKYKSE